MQENVDYITEQYNNEGLGDTGMPVSTADTSNIGVNALMGASQGATTGVSFGVVGAIIGGVAGGLIGTIEGIMGAKAESGQVKLAVANAIQSVKDNSDPKVLPSTPLYMNPIFIISGLSGLGFIAGIIFWRVKVKKKKGGHHGIR